MGTLNNAKIQELLVAANLTWVEALKSAVDTSYLGVTTTVPYDMNGFTPAFITPIGPAQIWAKGANRPMSTVRDYGVKYEGKRLGNGINIDNDTLAVNPVLTIQNVQKLLLNSAAVSPATYAFEVLTSNAIGFDGDPLFGNHYWYDENGVRIDSTLYNNDLVDENSTSGIWYVSTNEAIVYGYRVDANFRFDIMAPDSDSYFTKDETNVGYKWVALFKPGFAFNIVRSNAPLTEDNLQAAIDRLHSFKNPKGQPLSNDATTLIVPKNLEKAAKKILEATVVNGTDNIMAGTLKLIATKYLPTSNA